MRGGRVVLVLGVTLALAACGSETSGGQEAALAPDCEDTELYRASRDYSTDEALDLSRRQEPVIEVGQKVRPYTQDHADEFGGLWLDNERMVLVVSFTDHVDEHRAALERLAGSPDLLDVIQVAHTGTEITAIHARLSEDGDRRLGSSKAVISGSGSSNSLNRLTIKIVAVDDEARRVLAERYGADMICLEPQPGPGRDTPPGGGAADLSPLPTSLVRNGELALFIGVLAGADGCLWMEQRDGAKTSIRWPPGFGVRFVDGRGELVDDQGRVVAVTGDRLEMGGGHHDEPLERCDVGDRGSFVAGSVKKG